MHLRMAVLAAPVNVHDRVRPSRNGLVTPLNMASLAELRPPQAQELFVVRPMRSMTTHAVLTNRSMLPEEWPSLLLVTGVALVVDRIRADQFFCLRAMRIMARGALHPRRTALVTE